MTNKKIMALNTLISHETADDSFMVDALKLATMAVLDKPYSMISKEVSKSTAGILATGELGYRGSPLSHFSIKVNQLQGEVTIDHVVVARCNGTVLSPGESKEIHALSLRLQVAYSLGVTLNLENSYILKEKVIQHGKVCAKEETLGTWQLRQDKEGNGLLGVRLNGEKHDIISHAHNVNGAIVVS